MSRLIIISVTLITITTSMAMEHLCSKERMEIIGKCLQSNTKNFYNGKVARLEEESLQQKMLNQTCYENLKCFENFEHCDFSGTVSKKSTCEMMELVMGKEFQQCMEELNTIEDNSCIKEFMFVFTGSFGRPRSRKISCPVFKKFCVKDVISETCGPRILETVELVVEHLYRAKKCDLL